MFRAFLCEMKILLIVNPVSGNQNVALIKEKVLKILEKNEHQYILEETKYPNSAYELALAGVENKMDLILAIGGDGTVNEILNAIAYKDAVLGIIPTGTGNLLATALGIPIDTEKALDIALNGEKKKIDLGKMNDKYFSIIAGCGFDASIMKNIKKADKKLLGFLAYFIEGIKQAIMPKRAVFRLVVDGKKYRKRALTVLFINSGNIFGNLITIVPNASMTDGLIDVCVFKPRNTAEFFPILWKILSKQEFVDTPEIYHRKASKIQLNCRPKLPVQADGDFIGIPPLTIEACPQALSVMAPSKITTFVMNPEEFFKNLIEQGLQDIFNFNKSS